ncbi:pyridoxamine 5'-phosphate oxidase family protein [Aquabacterium sp.]|uniref:pyridoxamine 5'-phosphate oxidase family protein n=1 Tax=Aquabacterium sp. TaxID=1872578 RepID=UPI003D6CFAA9
MNTQRETSPFHPGEQHVQSLTGVREVMEARGRQMIRDHMPDQHRDFFATLPFIVIGALDAGGHPWATVMAGPPGFMDSPDARSLHLNAGLLADDPLASHWQAGMQLGLLGIQPHTRRRNRMNGVLTRVNEFGSTVAVRQSFGNCPKYIQPREAFWVPDARPPLGVLGPAFQDEGAHLSPRAQALIEQADTFFIASASPNASARDLDRSEGVDVSHRGGLSGFVKLRDEAEGTLLTVPDYTGNAMFNTLGNIVSNPKVGLLFMDFERGALLWLQGLAEVEHDSPEQAEHTGALRLLRIRVTRGRLHERGWPLAWSED